MKYGLSDGEDAVYCKSKKEYKPLIGKKNRSAADTQKLKRMSEEYRDWHRRQDIDNQKGGIDFNPKIHTSKIFSDLKGYTGGEEE